jgi:DGQHR domain-containing protein
MRSVTFSALKINQPIGTYYLGVISFNELVQISYADIRRLTDNDVDMYLGIQRPLNPKRVEDIRAYVEAVDATFPTSVILAVDSEAATWNEGDSKLTLSEVLSEDGTSLKISYDQIAKILDGQHRVAGLQTFTGKTFDICVAIFIGVDLAQQASIFGTVNLAQTKVNKSLVYDLYDLSTSRSPQKTCHNVAVALNASPKSPLYHRIKRLGVATEGRFNETITQATVVESLLQYISKKPNEDRYALMRKKKLSKVDTATENKLLFRNLFIDGEDEKIVKILWSYFTAVRDRWPDSWESTNPGNILPKTNGFRALMRFLGPAYLDCVKEIGELVPAQKFDAVFAKVKLEHSDFNIVNFPPGTSGEVNLYSKLLVDSELERISKTT